MKKESNIEDVAQDLQQEIIKNKLENDKKKLTGLFILLITANSLLYPFIIGFEGKSLFEHFRLNIFGGLALGFLVGILVAFIPYQNIRYSKKYLRASLLSAVVIETLAFLSIIFRSIPLLIE